MWLTFQRPFLAQFITTRNTGVVSWIVSPSDTLVTVPVTVRMVAWERGLSEHIVNIVTKSKRNEYLQKIFLDHIILIYCFLVTVLPTHIARGSRLLYGKTAVEDIGIVL